MERAAGWRRGDGPVVRAAVMAMALVVAAAAMALAGSPTAGATTNGVLPGTAFYPRAVVLAHAGAANGTVLASTNDGVAGHIWRSTDGGATFSSVSTISPGPDATFLCCIALWELPRALGPYPAGTLLWAGSVMTAPAPPKQMALRVWRSDDHGASWTPMAPCATSNPGGLWEPDFHVANDGSLVCTYSDETRPAHSQVLSQAVSHDGGQTWEPGVPIVADPAPWKRPGMATVAQLPDTSWVMTYEVCGSFPSCHVELRRSADGLDWGPADAPGERVLDTDGAYLAHTPVVSWTPAGGGQGTLLLSGQLLFRSDHTVDPGNGRTLFVNRSGGTGRWTRIDAPVPVADPVDSFCPNYSSPVIDLDGGGHLLELASFWDGPTCRTAFGTATVSLEPATPTTTTSVTSTTTTATPAPSSTAVAPAASGSGAAPAMAVGAQPTLAG